MTVFYNDILTNMIKAHISKAIQSYAFAKFARIKEFDPETGLVKVGYYNWETEEYDLVSNWMAYMTQVNGIGDDSEGEGGELWGHHYGPNINEQVYVIPHNGDHNNGIVIGSIFTTKRPPPTAEEEHTASGEFLWKHKTGSYMKFSNTGDVFIKTAKDIKINVLADGNILIEGDAHIKVGGNLNQEVEGNVTQVIKGNSETTAHGNTSLIARGSTTVSSIEPLELRSVASVTVLTDSDFTVLAGGNIILLAGEEIIADEGAILPVFPPVLGTDDLDDPKVLPGSEENSEPTQAASDNAGVSNVTSTSATIST